LSTRRTSLRDLRSVLPEGTFSVGAGLIIAGLAAYAFLSLSRVGVGKEQFTPVTQLWFLTFLLAPGFFLPVEQEVGRALAHRRALGQGGGPVVRRAALLGLALLGAVVLVLLLLGPMLVDRVFDGSWPLFGCLLLGFAGYAVSYFVRGVFAGYGEFGRYGNVLGTDGILRVAGSAALAMAGVSLVSAYGLLVGLPALIAAALAARGFTRATEDGPPASWAELTPNLGWLVAGSVLAAGLVNGGPVAAKLLADPDQNDLVSEFAGAVLIARVPLFLFQAVQAALLPKLARLAAIGAATEFSRGFRRLLITVIVTAGIGVVAAFTIGPWLVAVFFDPVGRRTLTLLALGSGLYMIALAIAQAVIALRGHAQVALGWAVGMATFLLTTAFVSDDLLLRVELGLVAGPTASMIVFGIVLHHRMAAGVTADADSMFEAIVDLPVEPA
jgi:O-antigen/teichoic acid export membrane protein